MTASRPSFAHLGLSRLLVQAIETAGFLAPSQIQAACIPPLLAGRDLLVEAPDGSGKTLAFVLPLLDRLQPGEARPQILVLTPKHEASLDVAHSFEQFSGVLADFHVVPLYDPTQSVQLRQLQRGAQVVVGEPRRLRNHIDGGWLQVQAIRAVVLDDADELLRGGFAADIAALLALIPAPRQVAVFAAYLSDDLRHLASPWLQRPRHIRPLGRSVRVPALRPLHWQVSPAAKLNALMRYIEVEHDFDAGAIFAGSRQSARALCGLLRAHGYAVGLIEDDDNMLTRQRIGTQLAHREIDLLVGGETLGQGLDLSRIGHLISYDMPCDAQAHARRLHPFARSPRRPSLLMLVAPREMKVLRAIERATRRPIRHIALPERAR